MKIRISSAVVLLILLNLFYIDGFGNASIFIVRYLSLPLAFAYIIYNLKYIHKNQYTINLVVICFCLNIIVSTDLYMGLDYHVVFLAINILALFIMCEIIVAKNGINQIIRISAFYFGVLVLVNDILIITHMFTSGISEQYFIGNKFAVSYYHMILLSFFLVLYKKKKIRCTVMFFLVAMVILYVQCITALVSTVIFGILMCLKNNIKEKMTNEKMAVVVTLFFAFILVLYNTVIMNLWLIQYFVVNILHKQITLTGRIQIYDSLADIVSQRLIFGYGYNTTIMYDSYGFVNAQNALFQTIVNYGIIGAVLVVLLIYFSFRKQNKSRILWPLMMIIYIYLFMGSVEIVFGTSFFMLLAIYNASKVQEKTCEKL